MYKRILVIAPRDCLKPFDYMMDGATATTMIGWNSGNNVFWFSIQKMLIAEGIDCDCASLETVRAKIDEINERYDVCVTCPANLLNIDFRETIESYSLTFSKLKIPIYVLGLGSQSSRDYDFSFAQVLAAPIRRFMNAVLDSGGVAACRGAFTGDCLGRLGFREGLDYSVVGCPAIYQKGASLTIEKKSCGISPYFNGPEFLARRAFRKLYRVYPNSWHVSQTMARVLLYRPDEISVDDLSQIDNYGGMVSELLRGGRLKYFCDVPSWERAILNAGFNFCVGTRIHGSIMGILSGIPAYILYKDSRVREIVEFFDIPHAPLSTNRMASLPVQKLFETCDYGRFNAKFRERYNSFKSFMNKHGLPWGEDMVYIDKKISELSFPDPPVGHSISDTELTTALHSAHVRFRTKRIFQAIRRARTRLASLFIFNRQARRAFRKRHM